MRVVILVSAVILFLSLNVVGVSAQTESFQTTFSVAGGQSVSETFSFQSGDKLTIGYTATASSDGTCLQVQLVSTDTFQRSSIPYNRTITLPPNATVTNATSYTVTASASVKATYKICPEKPDCQGRVSATVSYTLEIATQDSSRFVSNVGATAASIAAVGAILAAALTFTIWRKLTTKSTYGPASPSHT